MPANHHGLSGNPLGGSAGRNTQPGSHLVNVHHHEHFDLDSLRVEPAAMSNPAGIVRRRGFGNHARALDQAFQVIQNQFSVFEGVGQ